MEILRISDIESVDAAAHLFDAPPTHDATLRFLADDRHHLLVAYEGATPAGMVTGVEMTHPDKGTEMFLYELSVDEAFRRRGIGKAFVSALAQLARDRACYGMWVLTDDDNGAALATYPHAGGTREGSHIMLEWIFESP